MRDSIDEVKAAIVTHGKSLFDRGLASGSSGNISVRLGDGTLCITPTRSSLGRLSARDISVIAPDGSAEAGLPPSKELMLHQAIYAARSDARAVVHLHATASAAISCLDDVDPADCLPPITPYFVMKIGSLPLISYARPGAPELGERIASLAAHHPALLLANHGPIVSAPSLSEAVDRAEELEETAKLFLLLRGMRARTLSDEQVAELKQVFGDVQTGGDAQ